MRCAHPNGLRVSKSPTRLSAVIQPTVLRRLVAMIMAVSCSVVGTAPDAEADDPDAVLVGDAIDERVVGVVGVDGRGLAGGVSSIASSASM